MKSRSRSLSSAAVGLSSKSTYVTSLRSQRYAVTLASTRACARSGAFRRCGELQRRRAADLADRACAPTFVRGMEAATVNGIARETVDPWLEQHVEGATGPFEYRLIAGGRSNLTFAVTDRDGGRFVLRRPPLGHVLESAHDMGREHRIIAALEPTPVPVPRPLALCEDPAVNGAPFYVMELIDGVVIAD